MRFVLAFLGALAGVALAAYGATSVLVGFGEQRYVDRAYVVGFVPGSGCGDAHDLYLRIEDGEVLDCVPEGGLGSGRVHLTGFTDGQEDQVQDLVEQLGDDGLSAEDQDEVQRLVDSIAAEVPPAERPYGDQAVSGTTRIWAGAAMAVGGMLGAVSILFLAAPRQRPPR